QDFAVTAAGNVSFAAARSFFASVMNSFALFVQQAGIKLVAAAGKIRIEAQTDGAQIIAKQNAEIISSDGWINLTAAKGVRINGGGSVIEISPQGLIGYTNGAFLVHAASHATDDPKADPLTSAIAAVAPRICLECLIHAVENGASSLVRS
ncbi:DUF2345 domain-containing protein, partial [Caballeronia sp. AZ10_KS36]|uniref:DUF2345 domain-containing protein n=1 Tax=Caballeronia sp. AZ10_KS36 TaxID=2921757 RepID=UPI002027C0A4